MAAPFSGALAVPANKRDTNRSSNIDPTEKREGMKACETHHV